MTEPTLSQIAIQADYWKQRAAGYKDALHQISLASQNSMSGKDECGRIAREALALAALRSRSDGCSHEWIDAPQVADGQVCHKCGAKRCGYPACKCEEPWDCDQPEALGKSEAHARPLTELPGSPLMATGPDWASPAPEGLASVVRQYCRDQGYDENFLDGLIDDLAALRGPEGVWVPKEPTEAMIEAWDRPKAGGQSFHHLFVANYKAMLAAAQEEKP